MEINMSSVDTLRKNMLRSHAEGMASIAEAAERCRIINAESEKIQEETEALLEEIGRDLDELLK